MNTDEITLNRICQAQELAEMFYRHERELRFSADQTLFYFIPVDDLQQRQSINAAISERARAMYQPVLDHAYARKVARLMKL